MRNIKAQIMYDGTNYFGFQFQKGLPTIQDEVEKVLMKITNEKPKIFASSRTDRGVHALKQTISFFTNTSFDDIKMLHIFNRYLPPDIRVISLETVPLNFNARFSAKSKTYSYFVFKGSITNPFFLKYSYAINYDIDLRKIKVAIDALKGFHDFKSFANIDKNKKEKDTFCNIQDAHCFKKGDFYIFAFKGDKFLYHMIRRLVYYLLKVGEGKIKEDIYINPFNLKEVPYSRQVLAPNGLFLIGVAY